jgi:nitrogen-specific signal transduction histidine kinase
MVDYDSWLEYDLNPFLLFDKSGKVISLNQEANYLLSKIESKKIFNIALSYAPSSFGYETTFITLSLGRFSFFAITIGYQDENRIGIKLYKEVDAKKEIKHSFGELTNFYTVIDLSLSATFLGKDIKVIKELDPTIPQIRLNINDFVKLFSKILESFQNEKSIRVLFRLKTGEYIKIDNIKYQVVELKVIGEKRDDSIDKAISFLASDLGVYPFIKDSEVSIELPLIKD